METSILMEPLASTKQIDGARFREVLGSYPTGVAIVTGMDENGAPVGMVVGTFTSVSLDPPLIAYLPMKTSRTFARLRASSTFCVNILAADQEPVCRHFASPVEDKFAGLTWHPSPAGNPIIDGAVSWIDCNYASVTEIGDHYLVLGGILDMRLERDTSPLLFFQRGYGRFSTGALVAVAERETIQAVRLAEIGRDDIEKIATELNVECSLVASVGRDVVYVAVENRSPHWRLRSRLGYKVPFAPPLGTLFVGHPGAPSEAEWLERLGRADQEMIARSREQLHRARSRGWSISLLGAIDENDLENVVELYSNPHRTPEQERRLLATAKAMSDLHEPAELREDVAYDVLHLSVPVRNQAREVLLVLRLSALPRRTDLRQIHDWLARLQQTAANLEAKIALHAENLRPCAT
jgi:flavin reductase (DIM6/NTAB) family NADH-FMN oxidoreductase RutF